MNLALDTNRYVDFMRGLSEAVQVLRRARRISVPFVVLGELRAGFRSGDRGRRNEKNLAGFLSRDRVDVLWPDEATTHLHAQIFADLRSKGTPIPTNDLWIAALVVQHELPLYTRDPHFREVDHVAVV